MLHLYVYVYMYFVAFLHKFRSLIRASNRSTVSRLMVFSWPPVRVASCTSPRDHLSVGARCYPPPVGSVYRRKKFLLDGPQQAARSPLQQPDSSMCHYFHHLSQPCRFSPICHDRMFEGGPLEPKGMPCNLVIAYCSLFIMDTSGHGLMGGFGKKNGLGLCPCPLAPFWILTLHSSPMGSLLLTIWL